MQNKMHHFFDITEQITNGIDFEVHATRGEHWDESIWNEFESRKEKAAAMLRNDMPNNIFKIAQIVKLPVMIVREMESQYISK
ncbi:hypothetical protein [Bacillus sp. T2.9-1]|uniref:hypothetical protein n=2 Tax=Bacillales TaxID=1385 RepID=UPI002540F7DC|nr:hypothetical protein [Bacillus sp. T2.9-1]